MIFGDKFKKKYWGNYRAKIEELDSTIKNGVYKVRVYPFMATLKMDVLPKATSTLTSRFQHIQLKVGDWCWVFFENGDQHYPVIFDLCNYKDSYPTASIGTYGTYDKFKFNNFTVEIDEENKKCKILDGGGTTILMDSQGIQIEDANGNKIVMDSANGVNINSGNLTVAK